MAEKAIRQDGKLWAYDPDAGLFRVAVGDWLVYPDFEGDMRPRVGELRAIADDVGILVVGYDDMSEIELDFDDPIALARPISSRRELRR